jgi:hypothetical protein
MAISLLDNLLGDWKKLLTDWAGSGTLTRAASEALLLKAEPALLKKLVAQWSHGDFSGLPPIVLLPASSMPGAAGAYAISTGTIYLNQDWLAGASAAQAIAVLTEELGHHLDGLLNVVDTPGDEGEYFSVFLREDELTDSQKEGLRAENDSVAIKVGNKTLEVEYAIQAPSIQPIKQFPKAGDNFARKSSSDGTYIYVPSITSGVASLSKYDLVGGIIWERNLDQGGGWPSSSAVASDGSILVATGSDGLVGKVSTLARFSSTGNKIWEVNNSNQRYGQDIAVEGNTVYVSGGTGAGFSNSNTAFVNAYSLSTGSTLWSKTYANSGAAFINDLEINNGKIYCSAALYGKVDLDNAIAGCLDLNGNEIWWRSAPAPDWNGISAIRVVGSQLIGTGYKADGGDRGDTRLISFNTSDGTILWDTSWGDNNQQGSGAIEVLNGKIYVAYGDGVPWNSSAVSGGYSAVTELDTAGNLLNIYTYDVPNSYDGASEIVKVGDSLFLLGQTTGAIAGQANGGGYDIYLASVVKAVAPVVTLAVSPATVTENGPSNLIYTFSRTGPTAAALTVNYSIAGTAEPTDYTGATPGTGKTISFAAGSATATLTIDPTADSTIEADETVALTLATGTGYTLGTATAVVGTITNDDFNSSPTALNISATSFAENIVAGSTVASLSTTDPDAGNTFTYALVAGTGSTNNTAFAISGNQLKINASPDFEAKSSYSIRVRSTDQGGLFFERNLILAVNNLAEKVTASASTILAADKDTLELTGARNIFGMGNRSDNWITGNSGRNKLTGGLGKDVLTGTGGVDTFFYGSLKESLLSGFDVITDYAAGEKIGLAFNFEGDDLIASAGSINALSATQISTLLTTAKFLANTAEAFTVQSMSGTFVALNDAVAGFQAGNDALIHLSNYTIGVINPVSII